MNIKHPSSFGGGQCGVHSFAFPLTRLHGIGRQHIPFRSVTRASGSGKKEQEIFQGYVEPAIPPARFMSSPWYIKAPVALFGLIAVLRILKAITNRNRGSLDTLQGRGLISEERSMPNTDPFYDKVMKNVRTVQYEELSEDQIKAARMRRSRDRDSIKVDFEKMDLPANHPFAVKKQVSQDEEKLQKARLEVKRGLPLQDLSGNKGFPDGPPMQTQADAASYQAKRGGRQQATPVPSAHPTDKPKPHMSQVPPRVPEPEQ